MGLKIIGVIVLIALVGFGLQWLHDNVTVKKRKK